MPRHIIVEPLGPDERRAVEECWTAVRPLARRVGRRYPGLDVEGCAAHALCRFIAIHRGVTHPGRWISPLVHFALFKAMAAERPAGYKRHGSAPWTLSLDFEPLAEGDGVDADEGMVHLLSRLGPRDAALLWEHAVVGRSCAKIGAARGTTRAVIRGMIARATRRVRTRLES